MPIATPVDDDNYTSGREAQSIENDVSHYTTNTNNNANTNSKSYSDSESDASVSNSDSDSSNASDNSINFSDSLSPKMRRKREVKQQSPNWKYSDASTELEFQAYLKTKSGHEMLKVNYIIYIYTYYYCYCNYCYCYYYCCCLYTHCALLIYVLYIYVEREKRSFKGTFGYMCITIIYHV